MISFPTKTDAQGEYHTVREPEIASDYLDVDLNQAIEGLAPGFILEKLSGLVYGDSQKWHIIADNNLVRYPGAWTEGHVVKMPSITNAKIDTIETTRVYS